MGPDQGRLSFEYGTEAIPWETAKPEIRDVGPFITKGPIKFSAIPTPSPRLLLPSPSLLGSSCYLSLFLFAPLLSLSSSLPLAHSSLFSPSNPLFRIVHIMPNFSIFNSGHIPLNFVPEVWYTVTINWQEKIETKNTKGWIQKPLQCLNVRMEITTVSFIFGIE